MWLEWLLDAFVRPRTKAKKCKLLQGNDFRIHAVWGFEAEHTLHESEEVEELLVKPLGLREASRWRGAFAISAVLKLKCKALASGVVIGELNSGELCLQRIALLENEFCPFRITNGVVPLTDARLVERPALGESFPISYESWIPYKGELVRISGVVNLAGP